MGVSCSGTGIWVAHAAISELYAMENMSLRMPVPSSQETSVRRLDTTLHLVGPRIELEFIRALSAGSAKARALKGSSRPSGRAQ